MPDPVHLPVSLQPGQNARSAAPHGLSAAGQGAEAPFARSLAHLLRGGAGLPSQQDSSAGGGTDLPPMDQILPPGGEPHATTLRWQSGTGAQGEGEDSLTAGAGLPLVSGKNRPLASQQVLEDSQRELFARVPAASGTETEPLQSGSQREPGLQPGQQTPKWLQQARAEGQPADGMQASALEAAEPSGNPQPLQHGGPTSDTVGNSSRPEPGAELRSLNGVRDGGHGRGGDQAGEGRAAAHREARQDAIAQLQRSEAKQPEAAVQPVALAADSANDSVGQSLSAAAIGGVTRTAHTDTAEGLRRPTERTAAGTEAPAWQSGRSSEPLELAASVAGDRLQRFAEQWTSQMNERGGQSAWQGNGAGNLAGASSQPAGTAPVNNDSGSALSSPAAQAPSSAALPTATQTGSMPSLPSLTTMPGSSVEAAARTAVNPDAALAGSRESSASSGAGQSSAREQWGEALSQRISLMTARNQSEARIQLDPPELGRLNIQIQVNNEQASVSFTSPHALVRDALEANVPRLQDMLSEQGLDLLDVDISDQSQQQPDEQGGDESSLLAGADDETGQVDEPASPLVTESSLSLVDDYV